MKPGISRRFILTISIIFSACIIFMSLLFFLLLGSNARVVRGSLVSGQTGLLADKISAIRDSVKRGKPANRKDLIRLLVHQCSDRQDIFSMVIFSRTADDNYFSVVEVLKVHGSFPVGLEKGSIVREEGDINYLKKGRTEVTVDPRLHKSDGVFWQSVYCPLPAGRKTYIAGFLVSSAPLQAALKEYGQQLKKIKISIAIATLLLVLIVTSAGFIFLNNFTLLIQKLSSSMERAAKGELDINLNPETDNELTRLALSFNSLIGEMKELKEKEKITKETETKEPSEDIFKMGVAFLKDERLDDSIAVFRTLTLINPAGFSSFFNLGVAYAKSRKFEQAELMFNRALELNPEHETTLQYLEKVKNLHVKYGNNPSGTPGTNSTDTR